MKMTVKAELKETGENDVKIGVGIHHYFANLKLIPEFYIAILRAMRDAHRNEFYEAMTSFIDEEINDGGEDDG